MRNEATVVLTALLVLGTANAAPVAASPAKEFSAPAVPKSTKLVHAPKAPMPAAAAVDEKKVLNEKELQAEIASLEHLSPVTGELKVADHNHIDFDHEATTKANKIEKEPKKSLDIEKLKNTVMASQGFQQKVQAQCAKKSIANCASHASEALFCQLLRRSKPDVAQSYCEKKSAPSLVQISSNLRHSRRAPEDELAKEMTHDLEMNFNKIAPFGKEDTAKELQDHAAKTQDTLVDAVENAEVAEIKRAVFRALTRLRAATIKEFDTIARLETQAIDAYNDAHHYRAENPLAHLHEDEAPVETDKLKSFH